MNSFIDATMLRLRSSQFYNIFLYYKRLGEAVSIEILQMTYKKTITLVLGSM